MSPDFGLAIIILLACSAALLLFLILVLGVWAVMMIDWVRRLDSDPTAAEPYKIQMILGWPFGYYLNVYRVRGPSRKS